MPKTEILTPQNSPNHHTIGHYFRGLWGHIYYCDSYDPNCGYWMTPVKPNPKYPDENPQRTNVSERAIGRTLHQLDLYKLIKEGILTKQSAIAAVDKLNRQQVQEILKGEGFAVYDSEPLSKLRTALKAHIKDDPDFNWSIVLEMAG